MWRHLVSLSREHGIANHKRAVYFFAIVRGMVDEESACTGRGGGRWKGRPRLRWEEDCVKIVGGEWRTRVSDGGGVDKKWNGIGDGRRTKKSTTGINYVCLTPDFKNKEESNIYIFVLKNRNCNCSGITAVDTRSSSGTALPAHNQFHTGCDDITLWRNNARTSSTQMQCV